MPTFGTWLKLAVYSGCSMGFVAILLKISKLKRVTKMIKHGEVLDLDEVKIACQTIAGAKLSSQDIHRISQSHTLQNAVNARGNLGRFQTTPTGPRFYSSNNSARGPRPQISPLRAPGIRAEADPAGHYEVQYRGPVRGTLTSSQPVQSQLKTKIFDHLLKTYAENIQSTSIFFSGNDRVDKKTYWRNKVLDLNNQVNLHQHRQNELVKILTDEVWNQRSVALITTQQLQHVSSRGSSRSETSQIHYKSIQLKSGDTTCDIGCLAEDFPASELKRLGHRELSFESPNAREKVMIAGLVGSLAALLGGKAKSAKFNWRFVLEESEFSVRMDTPVMLVGDFVYRNGQLRAGKIDFFGNDLKKLAQSVDRSVWNWKFAGTCLGVALVVWGALEVLAVFDRKRQAKSDGSV